MLPKPRLYFLSAPRLHQGKSDFDFCVDAQQIRAVVASKRDLRRVKWLNEHEFSNQELLTFLRSSSSVLAPFVAKPARPVRNQRAHRGGAIDACAVPPRRAASQAGLRAAPGHGRRCPGPDRPQHAPVHRAPGSARSGASRRMETIDRASICDDRTAWKRGRTRVRLAAHFRRLPRSAAALA